MTIKGRPQTIAPEQVHAYQVQGMTQREAAAALNVSLSTVQKYWKRTEQRGRPSNTAEQVAQLTAEGMTTAQIVERITPQAQDSPSVEMITPHRRTPAGRERHTTRPLTTEISI